MTIFDPNDTKRLHISFQVPKSNLLTFVSMFYKASNQKLLQCLSGVNQDSGTIQITVSLSLPEQNDIKAFANVLNMIFARLFDFYPSFSEAPSINHVENVPDFIAAILKATQPQATSTTIRRKTALARTTITH